jgi:hypothetical protein
MKRLTSLLTAACLVLAGCGVSVGFSNSPLPPDACGVGRPSTTCNK